MSNAATSTAKAKAPSPGRPALVSDARPTSPDQLPSSTDQISAVQGKWGGQGASAFFVLHQTWTEKQAHHRQRARRVRAVAARPPSRPTPPPTTTRARPSAASPAASADPRPTRLKEN